MDIFDEMGDFYEKDDNSYNEGPKFFINLNDLNMTAKEEYDKLLDGGLLKTIYPHMTGNWSKDEEVFLVAHKAVVEHRDYRDHLINLTAEMVDNCFLGGFIDED